METTEPIDGYKASPLEQDWTVKMILHGKIRSIAWRSSRHRSRDFIFFRHLLGLLFGQLSLLPSQLELLRHVHCVAVVSNHRHFDLYQQQLFPRYINVFPTSWDFKFTSSQISKIKNVSFLSLFFLVFGPRKFSLISPSHFLKSELGLNQNLTWLKGKTNNLLLFT